MADASWQMRLTVGDERSEPLCGISFEALLRFGVEGV